MPTNTPTKEIKTLFLYRRSGLLQCFPNLVLYYISTKMLYEFHTSIFYATDNMNIHIENTEWH